MKLTVNKIAGIYKLLNESKLTNVSGDGRIAIVKMLRPFKKIALQYEDFLKDSIEKLRPENFDEILDTIKRLQAIKSEEERIEEINKSEETKRIVQEYNIYNAMVDRSLLDELNKEIDLEFTKLTEEQFNQLLGSNEYEIGKALELCEIIVE